MTSSNLKHSVWLILAASAAVITVGAPAYGKGGPPPDKGNKPSSEVSNSLSVPAILTGGKGAFTALTCGDSTDDDTANDWPGINPPDKAPLPYPASCADTHDGTICVDGGDYYVQRLDTWQAPCTVAESASAVGEWGDNLAGDASLKVGSPIRVELVLWDASSRPGVFGYHLVKLEPAELDRESDYGHWASEGEGRPPIEYEAGMLYEQPLDPALLNNHDFYGTFRTIVHDPAATLTIQLVDESGNAIGTPVFDGPAGAEINATGKIVYGHNLRVGTQGTYRITYHLPKVSLTECDVTSNCDDEHNPFIDIDVVGGGGGGGRRP